MTGLPADISHAATMKTAERKTGVQKRAHETCVPCLLALMQRSLAQAEINRRRLNVCEGNARFEQ
jgi:hypothetical protein